ncbi:cation:proton antiporter [Streptomyces sp. NPDC047079]|uniref:cation:proton antiporter n=1 Tax=Streptomyces sp. NPDC047079 TaxID=3154607 RepID=UPI0033D570DC
MIQPLSTPHLITFLLQIALLLALALALGRLAVRFGLPALTGELFAGVLAGPTVFGHAAPGLQHWLFPVAAEQAHLLDGLTQLGALLLVGITGAQLDHGLLRRRGSVALRISLGGLIVPGGLGIATGFLLPGSLIPAHMPRATFALFVGVAMCVTAIPVIAKILSDLDLLHRNLGQLIMTAALFDDAAAWLLLSVASALAAHDSADASLPRTFGYLVVILVVAVLARRIVGPMLRVCARLADPGPTIAVAVVLCFAAGAATAAAGLEPLFGAFVAGVSLLSLADPAQLAPLRSIVMAVLAPLFLAAIGLRMDLTALRHPPVLAAAVAVVAVATVGKFAGAYLGARAGRLEPAEGMALGIGMNARGVVGVVIAMAGLQLGVLSPDAFTVLALMAMVTSLVTPPLLRRAMRRFVPDEEELTRERQLAAWSVTSAS